MSPKTPKRTLTAKKPDVLPAESASVKNPRGKGAKKTTVPEILDAEEDADEVQDASDEDPDQAIDAELIDSPIEIDSKADPELRALSPTDPLKRYMEEVKRYPLLTHEQEMALVERMHRDGDIEAAKALVQANLRLVVKIAYEYRSMYSNVMDLIQEGNIGLMKAVSKFDPAKGARLGYYSSWWIKSYILKYLLDNFRLVKVGTTQAQKKLFYHLVREKERLEAQGLLAGPKLLAERLDVREKDVIEMQTRLGPSGSELSIDAPVDPDSERPTSLGSAISDDRERADSSLERQQLLQILESRLPAFQKLLNDRETKILQARLLADEPKTLQEVADLYGLTRERARQIEAKVIEKLREFLAEDLK